MSAIDPKRTSDGNISMTRVAEYAVLRVRLGDVGSAWSFGHLALITHDLDRMKWIESKDC